MHLLSKSKLLILMSLFMVCGGCADYLNHHDNVTLGVGHAPLNNIAVHTIDPFPPEAANTEIKIDAGKTRDALDRYSEPSDPSVVIEGAGAGPQVITGSGV